MKKRLGLLVLIGVGTASFLWAATAAPEFYTEWYHTDTITVDSQITEGFEQLASVIFTMTDTCNVLITVTGVAYLDPGDQLWIGAGNDSANRVSATNLDPNNNYDSIKVAEWPARMGVSVHLPFVATFFDSLTSQTDKTDTAFVNGAVKGSSGIDKVMIENFAVSVQIGDDN